MTIVPVIIREHESVGTDVMQIWSGNELNPSLGEPFESYIEREGGYLDRPSEDYFEEQKNVMDEDKAVPEEPNTGNTSSSLEDRPASSQTGESSVEQTADEKEAIKEKPPPSAAAARSSDESNYFWPESVRYSVHVNSFPGPEKEPAQARIKTLNRMGYECYMVYAHIPSMGDYYRIFVGKFDGFKSAQSFCEALKDRKEFAKDVHVADRKWAFGG